MWFSLGRSRASEDGAKALVKAGALLVDVRSSAEYASGHTKGAVNIPVQELSARLHELGATSRKIVVYCRSGARSAAAAALLRRAGYEVTDVGPMPSW